MFPEGIWQFVTDLECYEWDPKVGDNFLMVASLILGSWYVFPKMSPKTERSKRLKDIQYIIYQVDGRPQDIETKPQEIQTKDGAKINVTGKVIFQITDIMKYSYLDEDGDPEDYMHKWVLPIVNQNVLGYK